MSLSLTAEAQDHHVIRGRVIDSAGAGIPYVNVQATAQSRVVTDDSGRFEYRTATSGPWRLLARRIGYAPATLEVASVDSPHVIVLTRVATRFDAISVEATRLSERLRVAGFYERLENRNKGLGSGSFITAEDIEQRRPLRISHMLDAVNGIRVQKIGTGFNDWALLGPNGCAYTVYLNNARFGPRLGEGSRGVVIDNVLEPSATAAIEVYPRASSAPPQFQMMNGTCGVVVFWTK